MTEEELKKKLSEIGTIEVFKNEYVFTLLLRTENAGLKMLIALGLVHQCIMNKPNVEVLKNDDDFVLIVLKP